MIQFFSTFIFDIFFRLRKKKSKHIFCPKLIREPKTGQWSSLRRGSEPQISKCIFCFANSTRFPDSNHSGDIRNGKIINFCIETISQHFFQLRQKIFFRAQKKNQKNFRFKKNCEKKTQFSGKSGFWKTQKFWVFQNLDFPIHGSIIFENSFRRNDFSLVKSCKLGVAPSSLWQLNFGCRTLWFLPVSWVSHHHHFGGFILGVALCDFYP